MICSSRGCKNTPEQSKYLDNYLFCPECRTLTRYANFEPEKEQTVEKAVEERQEPENQEDEEISNYTYTDCGYHPKYTGQRKPRTDCAICWQVYLTVSRSKTS